jgi:hypothetical protein
MEEIRIGFNLAKKEFRSTSLSPTLSLAAEHLSPDLRGGWKNPHCEQDINVGANSPGPRPGISLVSFQK